MINSLGQLSWVVLGCARFNRSLLSRTILLYPNTFTAFLPSFPLLIVHLALVLSLLSNLSESVTGSSSTSRLLYPLAFLSMLTNFLLTPHSTRRLPVFRHLFSRSSTNIMSTPPSTGPLLGHLLEQGCVAWKTTPPLFGCPLLLSHLPISSPMPYGTLVCMRLGLGPFDDLKLHM